MTDKIRRLEIAATTYDRQQSAKRGYNPNALAMYLKALDEAESLTRDGMPIRDALDQWFYGGLLKALLKSLD